MQLASELLPTIGGPSGTCTPLQSLLAHGHHKSAPSPLIRDRHRLVRAPPVRCKRQQRTTLVCRAGYPFNEEDYHKVRLQVLSGVEEGNVNVGHLLFVRESETQLTADKKSILVTEDLVENGEALVMMVVGDTLNCIMSLRDGNKGGRPMSLDLLWQILERGQQLSKRDWKVLHVAVVDMRNQAYIGRVYFGDAETGNIVWDCDCRPSDGCWIALRAKAPLYIKKSVWAQCAASWRSLMEGVGVEASKTYSSVPKSDETITTVRSSDPEPVKRLKREMAVAITEEDYTTAARIRDHPFMMLQRRIWEHEQAGRKKAADDLRVQLENLINDWAANRPDR